MLPLTGERTVPGVPAENYWFRRHEAAYLRLLPLAAVSQVIEVGCGEGYGTAMIAARAGSILGIDYDAATVTHASRAYPRVRFARANLAALPVRSARADLLVSLQVIEHVWDHQQFVDECARVVAPGGSIVITTPNRLTFSPGRDRPLNPFHTHEFTACELAALLTGRGLSVEMFGLGRGRHLVELDERYGSFVDAQLASPPERWSAGLAVDVASIGVDDFVVTDDGLDDCLDLVAIARPL